MKLANIDFYSHPRIDGEANGGEKPSQYFPMQKL